MTDLLKKAFDEASKLPPTDQDAIATLILEELASEARWASTFAKPESQKLLRQLAEKAVAEYRAGKTKGLDPENL